MITVLIITYEVKKILLVAAQATYMAVFVNCGRQFLPFCA